MRRTLQYILRTICHWAMMTALLSIFLFLAAGTIKIVSLRAYLIAYSIVLLITMLAADPQLAHERANPGPDAGPFYLQFAPRFLFLVTLSTAAVAVNRIPQLGVPLPIRWIALGMFLAASILQLWAMSMNPFFSPSIRIQRELIHILVNRGPYRLMRHPGYLAMCVSVPASAIAIGSWLALIPAATFVGLMYRRAKFEDQFLKANLPDYTQYAKSVPSGLFNSRST